MSFPIIRPREEHAISRKQIDADVLRVLYRLHQANYKAYLVGGSVRDLLLGRKPKDFDIGTDARPQELRKLFRNCRIIGRRFRLAHVFFPGGKIVEVSTFRRRPEASAEENADILITEDNTFGTPIEDALRRDFTINGLFYDIADFSVIDYVGGLDDLEQRRIRAIGEPDVRFREDPVRMLRALEFAARLDFALAPDVAEAIASHRREIHRAAAARVSEEILGMLRSTHPRTCFEMLRESGMFELLLPEVASTVTGADTAAGLFWRYLGHLEARSASGQPALDDRTLLGLLLLAIVFPSLTRRRAGGEPFGPAELVATVDEAVDPLLLRLSIPKANVAAVKAAILMLGKLGEPSRGDELRIAVKSAFPLAFELFRIHAEVTGRHSDRVAAWQEWIDRARAEAPIEAAPAAVEPSARPAGATRRRRRRGGRGRPAAPPADLRFEG